MNFYEKLNEMCHGANITPTALCKTLKLSTSKVTAWKNGSNPSADSLIKISEYFGVSIDELLNVQKAKKGLEFNEEKILDVFRKLSEAEQLRLIINVTDYITDKENKNKVSLSQLGNIAAKGGEINSSSKVKAKTTI